MNPMMKILVCAVVLAGCSATTTSSTSSSSGGSQTPTLVVKAYVQQNLDELLAASTALRDAAPAPDQDGWNATADAAAVTSMRTQWKRARVAYERVEGAIAVLFPELDASTDERYDGFLETGADTNLFDRSGVTGIHGIERILWAGEHPARVVDFESALTGYVAATFPATAEEAQAFRTQLCQALVDDVQSMVDQFGPLALEDATAYRGVVGSMEEQLEKVLLAATGEEESRYAQHTLGDMRANLEGGRAVFAAFRETLLARTNGAALVAAVEGGFDRVVAAYAPVSGDALPEVPAGWSANPTAQQLDTPYGRIYAVLTRESDPNAEGALVHEMNEGGDAMGIPTL